MKRAVFLILILIELSSCVSTELVKMSVLEPAPVTISGTIKRIGVLNRSEIAPQNKVADVVDKVFSLEGKDLDREGALAGIQGLTDELLKNDRFTVIKTIKDTSVSSLIPGIFPLPLSWDRIEKICRTNNIDILFALELFDTDSKIIYSANPVSLSTPLGQVPGIEHVATMHTTLKTLWRIYDPVEQIILDEFPFIENLVFTGRGINPVKAAGALLDRKEALKQMSNKSGRNYAFRILPFWLRVSRDYYVRGSNYFRMARRKAQTGNWDGAALLWEKETTNPKEKLAGRACYNMAIINEINGNLDNAKQWARKAYENYNNKLALRYVNILENRAVKRSLIEQQESITRH